MKNIELFRNSLKKFLPEERIITDEFRRLAYGTDASFYRLIPEIVLIAENENDVIKIIKSSNEFHVPITFRAAGTSLSGQAVTDSVLVVISRSWKNYSIAEDAAFIDLQPSVVGAFANLYLKKHSKKIGPDPASINSAMIGGIAANNASGMCCGTAQNSYNTLKGMRIIFSDGFVLDTRDKKSISEFIFKKKDLVDKIEMLSSSVKDNSELADRIRAKFKMKNTTGYSINSLVDFSDPIDIIQHLMIGSEGTLGFISEIRYETIYESPFKASALMIFDSIHSACKAVPVIKKNKVDAVELMDRAALHSVENKKGMPEYLKTLPETAAALLVETSGKDIQQLEDFVSSICEGLKDFVFLVPLNFTSVKNEYETFWKIRKGLFPSVGAMREAGTTVIIEDVCFPLIKLADAAIDLQRLFRKYNYNEAIIFGHALEGNLHFVFNQDFNTEKEVSRYKAFMDELVKLVVNKYDGSLKAEHGTGRNMAPFVEYEWGNQAYRIMQEIKNIFDPKNLLNPGVLLNTDKNIHVKNLKPMPAANEIVDKCIECGFCEINCPSKDLTLTPRQRIVTLREISRLKSTGENNAKLNTFIEQYNYFGNQTCATDGLCQLACPVDINTGTMIKEIRSEKISKTADSVASLIADNMDIVTDAMRKVLSAVNFFHKILGSKTMQFLSDLFRKISFGKIPRWNKFFPTAADKILLDSNKVSELKVVYFPSCIARSMGVTVNSDTDKSLTTVTINLLKKAGYEIIFPENLNKLCCGMPFASKGFVKQGNQKSVELLSALIKASDEGKYPILFDTSPCLQRIKEFIEKKNKPFYNALKIYEPVEFILDFVIDKLDIEKKNEPIALHITCSSRKMNLEEKFKQLASKFSDEVIIPAEVGCCGFAGDRGFTYPELNKSALKDLKNAIPHDCYEGFSNSKTCEIGLSEHSGIEYRSIIYLVDKYSKAKK